MWMKKLEMAPCILRSLLPPLPALVFNIKLILPSVIFMLIIIKGTYILINKETLLYAKEPENCFCNTLYGQSDFRSLFFYWTEEFIYLIIFIKNKYMLLL